MNATIEILKKLLAWYEEDPSHWCQGAEALDAHGDGCDPHEDEVTSCCLVGGTARFDPERRGGHKADSELQRQIMLDSPTEEDGPSVAAFNDDHDLPEVKLLLKRTIARLESEAANA